MTAPTTAEVGHGNKQEQIIELHRLAEKGGIYEVQAVSNRHGVRGWRRNGVRGEAHAATAVQALSPDLHDLRRAFRHATAIYHDADCLERNGWVPLQGTVLKKMQERPSWESCS